MDVSQLVFILLFIAAAIFDATTRGKKKREMEEREKEAAEARRARAARTGGRVEDRGEVSPGMPGDTGWPTDETPAPVETAPPDGERRSSADELIPEDLWAILTGQTPPSESSPPQREQEPSLPDFDSDFGLDREPDFSDYSEAPTPPERLEPMAPSSSGRTPTSSAPTRRSARWMEGMGEEWVPRDRPSSSRNREPRIGGAGDDGGIGGEIADALGEGHAWGGLDDLAAGEIAEEGGSDDTRRSVGSRRDSPYRKQRRGTTESPYLGLLTSGDAEDVRRAIVLREVLGPPVGARIGDDNTPGRWRWEE